MTSPQQPSSDANLLALIKQLTELDIIEYEIETPTERIDYLNRVVFLDKGDVTITITCRRKELEEDKVKRLEKQNEELKNKLNQLNEILNPYFLEES